MDDMDDMDDINLLTLHELTLLIQERIESNYAYDLNDKQMQNIAPAVWNKYLKDSLNHLAGEITAAIDGTISKLDGKLAATESVNDESNCTKC